MRYSTKKDDAGYAAWDLLHGSGATVNVYLDGVEQNDCVTADDDAGYIRRCKRDEEGHIYAVGDEVAEEDVYGVVTFAVVHGQ